MGLQQRAEVGEVLPRQADAAGHRLVHDPHGLLDLVVDEPAARVGRGEECLQSPVQLRRVVAHHRLVRGEGGSVEGRSFARQAHTPGYASPPLGGFGAQCDRVGAGAEHPDRPGVTEFTRLLAEPRPTIAAPLVPALGLAVQPIKHWGAL